MGKCLVNLPVFCVILVGLCVSSQGAPRHCENATLYINQKCFASQMPATKTNISMILLYNTGKELTDGFSQIFLTYLKATARRLLRGAGCSSCNEVSATVAGLSNREEVRMTIHETPLTINGKRTKQLVEDSISDGDFDLPSSLSGNPEIMGRRVGEKVTCSVGYEGIVGEDVCAECYAGFYHSQDSGDCELCPPGSYQYTTGAAQCRKCPSGSTTYYSGTIHLSDCEESCSPGWKFDLNNKRCEECGYGYYQQYPDQTLCLKCHSGKTTPTTTSTKPDQCSARCPSGEILSAAGRCVDCPVGTYLDRAVNIECLPCPQGYTTEGPGTSNRQGCNTVVCYAGRYRVGTNPGQCRLCRRGTYKNSTMERCESCGDSEHYTTEQEGATSKDLCKYFCPAGTHIAVKMNQFYCKGCPLDSYKSSSDKFATRCHQCPSGRPRTSSTNATSVSECKYAACTAGQIVNPDNSLECSDCDYDYYQPSFRPIEESCIACPDSHGTVIKGAKRRNDCKKYCPAGEERLANGSCRKCRLGYYKSNTESRGARFAACRACPALFLTAGEGAKRREECNVPKCTVGEFRDSRNVCRPCPIGSYQNEAAQTICKSCDDFDPGTSTTITGATSPDSCNVHPNHDWIRFKVKFDLPWTQDLLNNRTMQYRNLELNVVNQVTQVLRQMRTYSNKTRLLSFSQGSVDAHMQALFQGFDKSVADDLLFRLRNKLIIDNIGPIRTVKGSNSIEIGYKNTDNDFSCGPGESFQYTSGTCTACAVGSYQPSGSLEVCLSCPGGQSTATSGLIGNSTSLCHQLCPPGYQAGSGTECYPCMKGLYKPNHSIGQCLPCPNGRITVNTTTVSLNDCIEFCNEGEYGDFDGCKLCPLDSYNHKKGQSSCTPCVPNTRTQSRGATSASHCTNVCLLGVSGCQNLATCDWNPNTFDVTCLCTPQYEGKYCEFRIPDSTTNVALVASLSVGFGIIAIGLILFCLLWCNKLKRKEGLDREGSRGSASHGHRVSSKYQKQHTSKSSFSTVQEQHVIHMVQEPTVTFVDPGMNFVHEPLPHQSVFFQAPETVGWGNHSNGQMFVDPEGVSWSASQRPKHSSHRHHGHRLHRTRYSQQETRSDNNNIFREDVVEGGHSHHHHHRKRKDKRRDKFHKRWNKRTGTQATNTTADDNESHTYEEIQDCDVKSEAGTSSAQTRSERHDGPKLTDLETGQDLDKILEY